MEEKGKLDKLDDSIKDLERKVAKMREPASNTFHKKTEARKTDDPLPVAQRFRVMVGAADRIENLWPK